MTLNQILEVLILFIFFLLLFSGITQKYTIFVVTGKDLPPCFVPHCSLIIRCQACPAKQLIFQRPNSSEQLDLRWIQNTSIIIVLTVPTI